MPQWVQHLLVLTIVAVAAILVARQAIASLRGKRSKLGSCCAKGCDPAGQENLDLANNPKPQRIVFLPVELLGKRK